MPPETIVAGDTLIGLTEVATMDLSQLESHQAVRISTRRGDVYTATGFHAIEAVYAFKPSALEGRRLRWRRGAWAFHNLVGHPVMQFLAWIGRGRAGVRFHDWTTPKPRGFRD